MNTGSCLCGDIQWQIDGPITMVVNCHCSMCRKAHGSAYGTFAVTAANDFGWTQGEDRIAVYESSPAGGRASCPRCGSVLPGVVGDMAFLPVGNLEQAVERPLDSHIFAASKAPWHEISDDAPQFDEYPPGYDQPASDLGERQPDTASAVGGSCLCGKVRYEFDGPPDRMLNCHCSRCRKSRSAVHSTQAFVAADRFRWLSGEDNVQTFKVPGAKYFAPCFCRDCGSLMPRVTARGNLAVIPAGGLDQDPGMRPQAHIFVGSKSPSHEITDALPQFDEYPPR